MTYGIFSLASGNALKWFDSEDEAFAAAQAILRSEPEASDSIGVMAFDEHGHPAHSWQGEELGQATHGVTA